jgi:hypothetical protein
MRIARFSLPVLAAALLVEAGCRGEKPAPPVLTYRIGDRVQVDPLVYTIISSEWRAQTGAGEQMRVPSKRFLLIHLSVTSGGVDAISVPQVSLIDEGGQTYGEFTGGADIPTLWGLVRNVRPADTLEGHVLFDVDPKSYKLRVEGGPSSNEAALVEIPLRFELKRPDIPSSIK